MKWRATFGGALLGFAVGWNFTNVGAVAVALADDYAVGLGVIGLFGTALFLPHTLAQLPGGRFADRFGPRNVSLVALTLMATGNAVALVDASPGISLAGRLVVGFGTGLGFVAGSDYMRLSGGGVLAQGIFGGTAQAGAGLALAVVPLLHGPLDRSAPFATALVLAAVALAALAVAPARRSTGLYAQAGRLRSLARDPHLLRLSAAHMALLGLYAVLFAWTPTLFKEAGGASLEAAGALSALSLVSGIVGRPLGGWLERRHPGHTRTLLVFSLAAGALGTLLLLPGNLVVGAFGASIVGLAAGIGFAPVFGSAARARSDAPGAAVGFVNMLGNAVAFVGTPLLGLAFALPGEGRIGFAVLALLWALPLLVLPRTNAR